MRRQLMIVVASVLAMVLAGASTARATTITDGVFGGWTFGAFGSGTVEVQVRPTGGNPNELLSVFTHTDNAFIEYGTAVNPHFTTIDAITGAFTLSLDVRDGPSAYGQGQAIQLLVEQGGLLYAMSLAAVTGSGHTQWVTRTYSGTFTPASFTLVAGSGPAAPNFAGGVATHFGFAAGNAYSFNLEMLYDNFELQLDATGTSTPMPEPGTALLMLTGLAAFWRRVTNRRSRLRRSED